jgi:sarcosine oxidase subunit alpha
MEQSTKTLARTPLHHWHLAHGAHMVERHGWQIPASYSAPDREIDAARTGLGLVDVSAVAKISFRGRGVIPLTHALVGDSPASKPQGVAAFDAVRTVLACRLTETHLLLLALTTNAAPLRDRLAARPRDLSMVESDVSCAFAAFGLLGAAAENVLAPLTALDVRQSAFPSGRCAETSLAGVHALLIRPPDRALDAVYVAVAWDVAEYVWEQFLSVGRSHGIEPLGLEAWHRLMGWGGLPAAGF